MAGLLHRHLEGNPLFMVAILELMTERTLVSRESGGWRLRVPLEEIEVGTPENLRQMIEAQIERLTNEQQNALEVASVTGSLFRFVHQAWIHLLAMDFTRVIAICEPILDMSVPL